MSVLKEFKLETRLHMIKIFQKPLLDIVIMNKEQEKDSFF